MTLSIATAPKNAMLDALVDLVDAGAGAGVIRIYDGVRPATADTALGAQVMLVEFACADPAFEAASGGSVAIDADPDLSATAVADGTASWARVLDSDGNVIFDGDVDLTANNPDFSMNSLALTTGQTVILTVGTIS